MENPCEEQLTNEADAKNVKVRVPKRVLHFSDGILEEFSTDEEDEADSANTNKTLVDPVCLTTKINILLLIQLIIQANLTWGPWFMYKAWSAGSSTLSAVDVVGEFFANLFGITTPKYYFELEEYKRRQAANKAREEHQKSWGSNDKENDTITVPLQKLGESVAPNKDDPVNVV